MMTYDESKTLYLRKLGKEFNELTVLEKAILTDVMDDAVRGRYSKFLMWSTKERKAFLSWLKQMGVEYPELEDAQRWAYEDAFTYSERT